MIEYKGFKYINKAIDWINENKYIITLINIVTADALTHEGYYVIYKNRYK